MTKYSDLLKLQAIAAIALTKVCIRWGYKDAKRVFVGPEAIALYRFIWRLTVVCSILLWLTGRWAVNEARRRIDAHIEACQKENEAGGHPPHQSVPSRENLGSILAAIRPADCKPALLESGTDADTPREPSRQSKRSRPSRVAQGSRKLRNNRGELPLSDDQRSVLA